MKKYILAGIVLTLFIFFVAGVFFYKKNKSPQTSFDAFNFPEVSSLDLTDGEKTKYTALLEEFKGTPEDASKLFEVARFVHTGGNFEKAKELYLKVLETRADDTLVLNNLADVYYTLGEFEKSEEMYRKIVEVNPKWLSAYFELANIYRYKLPEKYASILPLIDRGLQIAPENEEDFNTLYAVYYRDIKDKEKAIEYYEKVLEINPENQGAKEEIKFLDE